MITCETRQQVRRVSRVTFFEDSRIIRHDEQRQTNKNSVYANKMRISWKNFILIFHCFNSSFDVGFPGLLSRVRWVSLSLVSDYKQNNKTWRRVLIPSQIKKLIEYLASSSPKSMTSTVDSCDVFIDFFLENRKGISSRNLTLRVTWTWTSLSLPVSTGSSSNVSEFLYLLRFDPQDHLFRHFRTVNEKL
jgi:hypothetical protein